MEKAFVKNAGDSRQVKDGKIKEEIRRDDELNDLRSILSNKEGRRFVWGLLTQCGVFKVSYVGNANDTIFNEGKRNIGLKLLQDVTTANPDLYLKMAKESEEGTL